MTRREWVEVFGCEFCFNESPQALASCPNCERLNVFYERPRSIVQGRYRLLGFQIDQGKHVAQIEHLDGRVFVVSLESLSHFVKTNGGIDLGYADIEERSQDGQVYLTLQDPDRIK